MKFDEPEEDILTLNFNDISSLSGANSINIH
jgi:hypothetical protein